MNRHTVHVHTQHTAITIVAHPSTLISFIFANDDILDDEVSTLFFFQPNVIFIYSRFDFIYIS